jgi:tryptophan synthase beta subunit
MQVLGATVVPATEGGKSLKEAVDSACELQHVYIIIVTDLLGIINNGQIFIPYSHGLHGRY